MIEVEVESWSIDQEQDMMDLGPNNGFAPGLRTNHLYFEFSGYNLMAEIKDYDIDELLLIERDEGQLLLFQGVKIMKSYSEVDPDKGNIVEVEAEFSDFEMFSDKNEVSKKLL